MRALRWLLLGGMVLLVATLVFAVPAFSQSSAVVTGGDSKCLSCHAAEGMKHVLTAPQEVQVAPRGQDFNVTITVGNPWKHHLENVTVGLDLSNAPGLSFTGGEPPVESTTPGALAPGRTIEQAFTVTELTTEIHVALDHEETPVANTWILRVVAPNTRPWNHSDEAQSPWNGGAGKAVHLTVPDLILGGAGEWKAVIFRPLPAANPLPGATDPVAAAPYTLGVGVYGNTTGVAQKFVAYTGPRLDQGQATDVTIPLHADPAFEQGTIAYTVRMIAVADVPADHPEGHPPDMQDRGLWIETRQMRPTIGGERLQVEVDGFVIPEVDAFFPLVRSWGYAIGFASSFLMIPALLLGGTFGRGSVLWLNRVSLGARRRVLWHNASSFGLLFFAALHMLFFLLEPAKAWTIGALWGGSAIAGLILLGVTGALQRRFVERWGFSTWRYMHWGVAFLTVAFVLLHMGLDGTHFQFVRDWFEA